MCETIPPLHLRRSFPCLFTDSSGPTELSASSSFATLAKDQPHYTRPIGAESGIWTHGACDHNCFQDSAVMTASVSLRIVGVTGLEPAISASQMPRDTTFATPRYIDISQGKHTAPYYCVTKDSISRTLQNAAICAALLAWSKTYLLYLLCTISNAKRNLLIFETYSLRFAECWARTSIFHL